MSNPEKPLRDRLLSHYVPEPGKLASYRKEVEAMLEREEQRLRREHWYSGLLWGFAVFLGVGFALVAGYGREQPMRVYFSVGITLLILFVGGSTELLKYFINRARLEVQKDVKGLELRILELEGELRGHAR